MQVVLDKLCRREHSLKQPLVAVYLVGREQCRGTKLGGNNRGGVFREQELTPRLPVEVVAPTAAVVVARRAQLEQQCSQAANVPLKRVESAKLAGQCRAGLHSLVDVAVALQKQSHPLGIVLLGHHGQAPQVEGRALEGLYHDQAAQGTVLQAWQGLKHLRVETVVGVPALVAFFLTIVLELDKRCYKIHCCLQNYLKSHNSPNYGCKDVIINSCKVWDKQKKTRERERGVHILWLILWGDCCLAREASPTSHLC